MFKYPSHCNYCVFHLGVAAGVITAVAIGVPSISIISVLVYRYAMINLEDGKRILSGVTAKDVQDAKALAMPIEAQVVSQQINYRKRFHG